MARGGHGGQTSGGGERIALAVLAALVICFLSFLFRGDNPSERMFMIGEPRERQAQPTYRAEVREQETARRPYRDVPATASTPQTVRESGLSEGAML